MYQAPVEASQGVDTTTASCRNRWKQNEDCRLIDYPNLVFSNLLFSGLHTFFPVTCHRGHWTRFSVFSRMVLLFIYVFFAKIRYTWQRFGQSQLHAKNKYQTHPRNPAIGQADIVLSLARKGQGMPVFLYCLAFNWFWPTLNQSERPYVHSVVFLRMRLPSLGWNCSILTYKLCTRTLFVKVRIYTYVHPYAALTLFPLWGVRRASVIK